MSDRTVLRAVLAAIGTALVSLPGCASRPATEPTATVAKTEASREEVIAFCGACHAYPLPETFPRELWKGEVERGFQFFEGSGLALKAPDRQRVVRYYEDRAPVDLPILEQSRSTDLPVRLARLGFRAPDPTAVPAIANVRFVHLFDQKRLDVVACDMLQGQVLALRPYEPGAKLRVLADGLQNPGHAEVVDLDGDGHKDLIVADLGSPRPTDNPVGRVIWLRGGADGRFTPIPLAWDLGRAADAQAADFDGDGDLDLVVAAFGMHAVGNIVLLENQTKDYAKPKFVTKVLDPRPGTINVPVADLNGDGRPDFVALISQEHETVVAFLNAGGGKFEKQVIFKAPHPSYGSSGIELVDMDHDGDLDVLYANGDTLDLGGMLRPYHGIQWLENRGTYPFEFHRLTSIYGVHRAQAADLDGDGDLDIVATCFLPRMNYREACRAMKLDAIIMLEQTAPGKFARHAIETSTCDHATCDLGDYDGDGTIDIVTGNFINLDADPAKSMVESDEDRDAVILLKNLGPRRRPKEKN